MMVGSTTGALAVFEGIFIGIMIPWTRGVEIFVFETNGSNEYKLP